METNIEDGFGRRFPYLRLSVTEACNFRCSYCLPEGYRKTHGDSFLSVPEIRRLVEAFAGLGCWKVRLTGGEPTVRKDFCDIAKMVAGVLGIRRLAFTTNGYGLAGRARGYHAAGLRAVNISIDSLDPRRYCDITGHDRLVEVVEGVQAALDVGFDAVKINAVLLKGLNDDELEGFLDFIADRSVSLRFIELMETGDNADYFRRHHVPAAVVREKLAAQGWRLLERGEGQGPAVEYAHSGYRGRVGIIAPYSKGFCAVCNRLRVSARGDLHLCLFGTGGHSLRPLLQEDGQKEELQETVLRLMRVKKISHFLNEGDTGARQNLASTGG
ncbi:MAG: GTP 3',8-cyclase MoaA [Pseudomonadota bacterium]